MQKNKTSKSSLPLARSGAREVSHFPSDKPGARVASIIYKICPARSWREAERAGRFDGAPVDHEDGFIHFSTAAQAAETAAKHFAGATDLVLVAVDGEPLGGALRWEPSRGGDLFPHLYGALPLSAVLWAVPLPLGPDGRHVFPERLS
jgi:uncharacterized protein (DUF952 family)